MFLWMFLSMLSTNELVQPRHSGVQTTVQTMGNAWSRHLGTLLPTNRQATIIILKSDTITRRKQSYVRKHQPDSEYGCFHHGTSNCSNAATYCRKFRDLFEAGRVLAEEMCERRIPTITPTT
ncbi:hypothetical protein BT63DRAFT_5263 [Microthyrium microscopicum]|uniref:Uncharacterized protein n=1 Tax=Microthyrium microscopicum TaxID=703497 RepID=A0A6A6US63_9PEZI|nr:hypothetical protein BT63DRAFT_5263 [Microthyrium microscopicum]